MTQRIFKMDCYKDVRGLFDILPENCVRIVKDTISADVLHWVDDKNGYHRENFPRVDWCGKDRVVRPPDYSRYVGKLGLFFDESIDEYVFRRLAKVDNNSDTPFYSFRVSEKSKVDENGFREFRPLTDDEKADLA
jgi:hypothetical protein